MSNNPILTLKIESFKINNSCQFVPYPASISIQLDNYQMIS